jgi:type III pantothenate kinase
MLLAIDVGNSHTVMGVFKGEKLLCHWRLKTDRQKTADGLAAAFHSLFAMQGLSYEEISQVVIASVVPTQQLAWKEFAARLDCPILVVDSTLDSGITIKTDSPAEVGADRIVNAVAGYHQYKQALIVIDFGTAITFDCVSGQAEYLGGAIIPGIAVSLDALAGATAKLPRIDISQPPESAIGTNTVSAIRSGLLYGYGSMVDGMVERLRREIDMTGSIKVIATGGMAELIKPYTTVIDAIDPMLTLEGLRLLYERNR